MQAFDAASRGILLDIIEDRHGKRSTIVASQIPVSEWYERIGEKTVADAILDRIVHHARGTDDKPSAEPCLHELCRGAKEEGEANCSANRCESVPLKYKTTSSNYF